MMIAVVVHNGHPNAICGRLDRKCTLARRCARRIWISEVLELAEEEVVASLAHARAPRAPTEALEYGRDVPV